MSPDATRSPAEPLRTRRIEPGAMKTPARRGRSGRGGEMLLVSILPFGFFVYHFGGFCIIGVFLSFGLL